MDEADERDEPLAGVVSALRLGGEMVRSTWSLLMWGVGVGVDMWVVVFKPEWLDPLVVVRGAGSVAASVVVSGTGFLCRSLLGEGPDGDGASRSERHSPSSSIGSVFGSTLCRTVLAGSELPDVAAACWCVAAGGTTSTSSSESDAPFPRSAERFDWLAGLDSRYSSISCSASVIRGGSCIRVALAPESKLKVGLMLRSSASVKSGAGSIEAVGIMSSSTDSSISSSSMCRPRRILPCRSARVACDEDPIAFPRSRVFFVKERREPRQACSTAAAIS